MAKDCTAVISCVGVIGTSEDVKIANKGTGFASKGAKAAGVKKFVYISVAPEVKESVKGVSAFDNYMEGKAFSEDAIKNNFVKDTQLLLQPSSMAEISLVSILPVWQMDMGVLLKVS